MPVTHVHTEDEFNKLLASPLAVVDFFAEWCGPCKRISPALAKMSDEFSGIAFIKIDVDELEDLSGKLQVSAMPTFRFYKGGKQVDELVGADEKKLRELIEKLKA